MSNILYKHLLLKASPAQSPDRIDTYIPNNIKNYSRSNIKKLCAENRILVNDAPVKASYTVKPGDEIFILLPYTAFGEKPRPSELPLSIMHEDEQVIVVNKPAGIAVHPGLGDYDRSLLNGLLHHTGGGQVFVVHRLDKHTSGPVVFAKTPASLEFLQRQFSGHETRRVYHCLAWGNPPAEKGIINTYIGRNPLNEMQICVSDDKSFGKQAITNFRVLKRYGAAALMECILETGRTHQIRIHMQHIGHSLVSDQRYPDKKQLAGKDLLEKTARIMPHQALHATLLGFINPFDNGYLEFQAEYPPAFKELLHFFETLNSTETALLL